MKIQVVGYAASGKSTFAKQLKKHHGLPLLHIDTIFFGPSWVERDRDVVEQEIRAFMTQDDWIIDGQYRYMATERYDECDQLFIFEFSRFTCLFNAIVRRFKYHNKVRDSIAPGCKEKLDPGFVMWILWTGRTKASRDLIKRQKTLYKDKVVVFKNRRQVKRYLMHLDQDRSKPGRS